MPNNIHNISPKRTSLIGQFQNLKRSTSSVQSSTRASQVAYGVKASDLTMVEEEVNQVVGDQESNSFTKTFTKANNDAESTPTAPTAPPKTLDATQKTPNPILAALFGNKKSPKDSKDSLATEDYNEELYDDFEDSLAK